LVHTQPTHIVRDGLFVPSLPPFPSDGSRISASAELETTAAGGAAATVKFTLWDTAGTAALAEVSSAIVTVPPPGAGTVIAAATLTPPAGAVKFWSVQNATMYSVTADVMVAGAVVDSQRVDVGFRTTAFSGASGAAPFELNGEAFQFRGFSHHNSIGGLGVAIPERIDLFRVQVWGGRVEVPFWPGYLQATVGCTSQ
jgi:beta-galactosidase/beta-glucuronidase